MRAVCEEIRLLVSFRNLGPSALPSWGWEQAQYSLTTEGEFRGGGWQHGLSQTSDRRRTVLGKPQFSYPRLSLVRGLDAASTPRGLQPLPAPISSTAGFHQWQRHKQQIKNPFTGNSSHLWHLISIIDPNRNFSFHLNLKTHPH